MSAPSPIDGSTVFVTGATGFIGSHLVDHLLQKNCTVLCLVRKTSSQEYLQSIGAQLHAGNLNEPQSYQSLLDQADYVFHCAGLTKARNCKEYFESNAEVCRPLYRACAERSRRIKAVVHLSSLAAVGPSASNQPVDENSSCRPLTHYGKSKLAGEEIALSFSSDLPMVVLRPPVVYGEREENFFTYLKSIQRGWIFIVGKAQRHLSLIYVEDLVRGMVRAATPPTETQRVFFITDGHNYSWDDVAEVAMRVLNVRARRITIPENVLVLAACLSEGWARLGSQAPLFDRQRVIDIRQSSWTASAAQFFEQYSFQPHYDLSKGLTKTLNWYRQQGWF